MTAPTLVRAFAVFLAVGLVAGVPAAVLAALRRVLRRRYSAAGCSALWTGLAVLLLALPVLVFGVQALQELAVRIDMTPQSGLSAAQSTDEPKQTLNVPAQSAGEYTPEASPQDAFATALPEFPPEVVVVTGHGARLLYVAALVWLAGAAAGLLVTALHYGYWRAQCRRWQQTVPPQQKELFAETCARVGVRRAPQLQCSGWVRMPLLAGVLRPVLVLPVCAYENRHLDLILTHELIHLQRRDVLRQLLVTAAGILYWYNPAVWLLAAAARRDAEQATDAAVLAQTGTAADARHSALYSEVLLQSVVHARSLPLVTGFSASKKELMERMKHLFDARPGKRGRVLTALLLCLTLTAALTAGCAAGALRVETEKEPLTMTQPEIPAEQLDSELQETVESALENTGGQSVVTELQPETPAEQPDKEPPETPADPVRLTENAQPGWMWPVADYAYCSKGFVGSAQGSHNGIDICAAYDTPITAAADGTVQLAEETSVGDGVYVVLVHGDGVTSKYAHCSRLAVQAGDAVKAGDLIAWVGSTGNSTGNHCHFEICEDGVPVDPAGYVGGVEGAIG